MLEQLEPGFYAVGEEDVYLVASGGQILRVLRGGMDGPAMIRVDGIPEGLPYEPMDNDLVVPTLMLRAAEMLAIDAGELLGSRSEDEVDVLDEILWGGPVGGDAPHVETLVRDGLVVLESGRAALSLRCRTLLDELCVALCGRPYAGRVAGKDGAVQ